MDGAADDNTQWNVWQSAHLGDPCPLAGFHVKSVPHNVTAHNPEHTPVPRPARIEATARREHVIFQPKCLHHACARADVNL